MDLHQCMTCGERWGVGTTADSTRLQKHQKQGHRVLVGDDTVLTDLAEKEGVVLAVSTDALALVRCFDCEQYAVAGTQDGYDFSMEHRGLGHYCLVGEEPSIRLMVRPQESVKQSTDPFNPEKEAGSGALTSFGGDMGRY